MWGTSNFIIEVGIGLFIIFYAYMAEFVTRKKAKPVPFLKLRLLKFLGLFLLVLALLGALFNLL